MHNFLATLSRCWFAFVLCVVHTVGERIAPGGPVKPPEQLVDSFCLLQSARLPSVLKSGGNGTSDVCESRSSSLMCTHTSCRGRHWSPALGKIDRADVNAVPIIAGLTSGSSCVISRKYKFIFVHILKNAGTSTKAWLLDALCPGGRESCSPNTWDLMDCHASMTQHPEYFRWSFARHPFDRALSIYAMAKNYNLSKDITFEAFWLDEDRWAKTQLDAAHALPQSSFVMSPCNCLAIDFIGWLPNAEEEVSRVVDLIGAEPLQAHFKLKGFPRPTKGNVFGFRESEERGASGIELVNRSSGLNAVLSQLFIDDLELLVSDFQGVG